MYVKGVDGKTHVCLVVLFWLWLVSNYTTFTDLMLLKLKDVMSPHSTCVMFSVVCSTLCTTFFGFLWLSHCFCFLHIALKWFALPHPLQLSTSFCSWWSSWSWCERSQVQYPLQLNLARGLTQPSIPLWVEKMSTSSDGRWMNNVHFKKKVHCTWKHPCDLYAPQGVETGGGCSLSHRNDTELDLSWGSNNVPCEVP